MQQAPLLGVSALAALAGAYVGYQLCQRRHSRRHRVAFVMELNGREHKCEYAKRHDGKAARTRTGLGRRGTCTV
jgi:hypothetical protein